MLPPEVNHSSYMFEATDPRTIRYGLGAIVVDRRLSTDRAVWGDEVALDVEVWNQKLLPVPLLVVGRPVLVSLWALDGRWRRQAGQVPVAPRAGARRPPRCVGTRRLLG